MCKYWKQNHNEKPHKQAKPSSWHYLCLYHALAVTAAGGDRMNYWEISFGNLNSAPTGHKKKYTKKYTSIYAIVASDCRC